MFFFLIVIDWNISPTLDRSSTGGIHYPSLGPLHRPYRAFQTWTPISVYVAK